MMLKGERGRLMCGVVINQTDTSQARLSSKGGSEDLAKTEMLSKDELYAVLKYRAQSMCVLCRSVHCIY